MSSAGHETLVGHLGVRFPAGVLLPALVTLLWFHSSQRQKNRRLARGCDLGCWLRFACLLPTGETSLRCCFQCWVRGGANLVSRRHSTTNELPRPRSSARGLGTRV